MTRFIRLPDGTIQPILEPEPETLEEQEEEQPEGDGKVRWVGSDQAARQAGDGISDLFEVDTEDDTKDLISVDIEKDIIDADEDGGLDSLTEVSEEDILGDEETDQVPLEYKPDVPRRPITRRPSKRSVRYLPPATSVGGFHS